MRSSCETCCWRCCCSRGRGGGVGGGDAAVAVEVGGQAMAASGALGTLGSALALSQTRVSWAAEPCEPAAHGGNLSRRSSWGSQARR